MNIPKLDSIHSGDKDADEERRPVTYLDESECSLEDNMRRTRVDDDNIDSPMTSGPISNPFGSGRTGMQAEEHQPIRKTSFFEFEGSDVFSLPEFPNNWLSPLRVIEGCSMVHVFDMRNGQIVEGEMKIFDVKPNLLIQRLAACLKVREQALLTNPASDQIRAPTTFVAVLEEPYKGKLTVFLLWENGNSVYYCATLDINATTDTLTVLLKRMIQQTKAQPFCLFYKDKKLLPGIILSQRMPDGSGIIVRITRPQSLKCVYRASSRTEHIYSVDCLTTDSVEELKLKIRKTILEETKQESKLGKKVFHSYMWLTIGNIIFEDSDFIWPSDKLSKVRRHRLLAGDYDVVIHLQPQQAIVINVIVKANEDRDSVDNLLIIQRSISTRELRYHVSTLLLKLICNRKKITEVEDISVFPEIHDQCKMQATIRNALNVIVKSQGKSYQIPVMKLDLVLHLKGMFAGTVKKTKTYIKLCFEDKEPDDYQRIEQAHIKDNSEVAAEILDTRIIIRVCKSGLSNTHLIIDDIREVRVRDLKNFCISTMDLNHDIDLHILGKYVRFEDNCVLDEVGLTTKSVLFITAKDGVVQSGECVRDIYETDENGVINIRKGVIKHGHIFFANAVTNIQTNNQSDEPLKVENHRGIRKAYQHEINVCIKAKVDQCDDLELPWEPARELQIVNYETSLELQCKPVISYGHSSNLKHSLTELTMAVREPPGVASDSLLRRLTDELPGNLWQSFMRDLLKDCVISKVVASWPNDVNEQIYQCLLTWKRRNGVEAKTKILAKALLDHHLKSIHDELFDYETV
ncbi:hypothetical protein SNE40_009430 [Patella caerulea]|uniref:Death domain-containing protein n=1 Tax=Patella caerulea TaxID=87958 RepID=A0AAN8JVG1_PATCE